MGKPLTTYDSLLTQNQDLTSQMLHIQMILQRIRITHQHSSLIMILRTDTKLASQLNKCIKLQRFCYLIFRLAKHQFNFLLLIQFLKELILNFNMLTSSMSNWILSQVNCRFIIYKNLQGSLNWIMHLDQQTCQPNGLTSTKNCSNVLHFWSRESDNRLLLRWPWTRCTGKYKIVARSAFMIVQISSPVTKIL